VHMAKDLQLLLLQAVSPSVSHHRHPGCLLLLHHPTATAACWLPAAAAAVARCRQLQLLLPQCLCLPVTAWKDIS
jgi:hypothetical protein